MVAAARALSPAGVALAGRLANLSWAEFGGELDASGAGVLSGLLSSQECAELIACYVRSELFRSRIVMSQHGFGRGEYQYFSYPLPATVQTLRENLYPRLAPIANRWHEALQIATRFPARHEDFLDRCHRAGQRRPTPLLLRYGPGDFNCLHQDVYGEQVFPLQLTVLLSDPATDFSGGEFCLTQQRPRAQSRVEVMPLARGDGVVFATRFHPAMGKRGAYRLTLRHGVSRLRRGERYTLGVIFHDAQ
ncbi:MAG TPA: 2OG-Fe(II) oxygenase [Steroidobacteraceae bacterium]